MHSLMICHDTKAANGLTAIIYKVSGRSFSDFSPFSAAYEYR
jgi:hypothetical protein